MPNVFIVETEQGIEAAVREMFSLLESPGNPLLKKSKEIYIKVNGIDFKKHCFTSPAVLEAICKYLREKGATVYVMENSTQSNLTRIVFSINGYLEVCERTKAIPIYLDEEDTEVFEFKGKESVEEDPKGYRLKTFGLPETIVKIIKNRDSVTYLNLPKLKTHSMAVVTLGIKNQWGFPQHSDRVKDHSYNLHSKLVDVYGYIQPDLTIIDGIEGTIHGHYPPTAWEDRLVKKFNILIGGRDTVAVDVVGARIFGLTMNEVPHLQIAHNRGLGEGDLNKIKVIGKNLNSYTERYGWDLLQEFPPDVKIIKGSELLCREGCQNNPLTFLQVLANDFKEKFKGGFFMLMGKGFEDTLIEQLKAEGYKKGLVAGYCAIEEVGEKLRKEFGKRNIHFSHDCNNLPQTANALCKLSRVSILNLLPISLEQAVELIKEAEAQGTTSIIPELG
ncbi:MAG: DUF362 domain-containing protein [Candidatus Helarchaeota archaeon]|nr:DUF362 domain-containing protein [Candidatus Helarchaeota archaeon]